MPNPGSTPLVKHPEDNDLFYLELRYDQLFTTSSPTGGTISGLSGTLQKGGNIAQMAWRVRGRERQAYAFTYDTLSRLKTASYFDVNTSGAATASSRFNEALTYDLRGNIGTLQRQGFIQSTCNFGQIDNLAYTYAAGTNRLTSVADASGKTEGFKPGSGAGYTYDGNGNLKSDSYKGISTITYNHLNLPRLITFSTGNTIEIVYDASGNKLRKIVKQGATVQYEQDYSGGIEYRKTPAAGTFRIEAIYHEEGRYFNLNVDVNNTPSWRKEYALRDHLGSTRLLFADKDGDGMVEVTSNPATNEILQELHYYPFGLSYGGSHWMNDAARDNGYKYNSKELNEDWGLGWYDYGARWYMPDLGRWGAVDPLAEDAPDWTPYRYGFNNPISYTDPDGLFESEEAARKYAKENNIKIRPQSFIGKLFTSGSRSTIEHNSDGSYSIDNRKESTSISDLGGDLGVMAAVLATPNDVINIETEGNLVLGQTSTATLRDGSEVDVTPLSGTAPTPGIGRVPKGETWWNSIKKVVQKGGTFKPKKFLKLAKEEKTDFSKMSTSRGNPPEFPVSKNQSKSKWKHVLDLFFGNFDDPRF
ncbi:MAG: RHS repeat-associated core domain-containing protein [Haliscomenobacter sp.]|nr:RHS repeat-associated core domain-containing protein [Haliscomenobacter sp.]